MPDAKSLRRQRDELIREFEEAESLYNHMAVRLSDRRFVAEREEDRQSQKTADNKRANALQKISTVESQLRSIGEPLTPYTVQRQRREIDARRRSHEMEQSRQRQVARTQQLLREGGANAPSRSSTELDRSSVSAKAEHMAKMVLKEQKRADQRAREADHQAGIEAKERDLANQQTQEPPKQEEKRGPELVSPAQEAEERVTSKSERERLERELKNPDLLLQRKHGEWQQRLAAKLRKEKEQQKHRSRDVGREPDW